MHKSLFHYLGIGCVVMLFWRCPQAQESCSFEVKILLAPQHIQQTLTSLHAEQETTGQVFFFDTKDLDLLAKGVILRVRRGAHRDLTLKLRSSEAERLSNQSCGQGKCKCEMDLIAGRANYSYSVQSQLPDQIPDTGVEMARLLTAGQRELLKQARASIDWTRVKRVAVIQTTAWRARASQSFNKLDLELWEWPDGKVLELSTKVSADAGPTTYVQLEKLLKARGIVLNSQQEFKTAMVLRTLLHQAGK